MVANDGLQRDNKRKKEGVTLAKMTVKMDVITQERTRYKMII